MMELVLVVCLAAEPARCEERSVSYTDESALTCLVQAQAQIAQWLQAHPHLEVARWFCRDSEMRPAKA